jgi:hypothetical protein
MAKQHKAAIPRTSSDAGDRTHAAAAAAAGEVTDLHDHAAGFLQTGP